MKYIFILMYDKNICLNPKSIFCKNEKRRNIKWITVSFCLYWVHFKIQLANETWFPLLSLNFFKYKSFKIVSYFLFILSGSILLTVKQIRPFQISSACFFCKKVRLLKSTVIFLPLFLLSWLSAMRQPPPVLHHHQRKPNVQTLKASNSTKTHSNREIVCLFYKTCRQRLASINDEQR